MNKIIKQIHLTWLLILLLFLPVKAQNQLSLVTQQKLPKDFIDPPREFSVMPFWFWNDTLKDEEIVQQIVDFESHGVYGFVIHPRIGLPGNVKWLGPEMIHAMNVAISEAARRLSWLNTDSRQICDLAILCEATWLPDKSAKTCYQNQRDFNYLEIRHLWEDAKISSKGVHLSGMTYRTVVLDSLSYLPPKAIPILKKLARNRHLIINHASKFVSEFKRAMVYKTAGDLITAINNLSPPDLVLTPASGNIRYRHVEKGGDHYYLLFNEEDSEVITGIRLQATGKRQWFDPFTAEATISREDETIHFKPHEMKVFRLCNNK